MALAILLTLLHSEKPKLYTILAFLGAVGLRIIKNSDLMGILNKSDFN